MGYSSTTRDDLAARAAYRASSGTSYAYSDATAAAPRHLRKVHESLDPKWTNSDGRKTRECRDSAEHPNTVGVVVAFDETGSMGHGPVIIQNKLADLKGITLRAGLDDVQLAFGAYGDAACREVAPCQIGQFESGLEMEEWLNNLYLEGQGGANGFETAGLLLYFLAQYAELDSLEKRDKKGYIFLTGDETSGPVTREEVREYLGDDIQGDLTIEEVVEMARQKFEIFFCLVQTGAARQQGSEAFWNRLLGTDHVLIVEDLENIAELVGGVLAHSEGMVEDVDDLTTLLASEGSDSKAIELVARTVARIGGGRTNTVATAAEGTLAGFSDPAGDLI